MKVLERKDPVFGDIMEVLCQLIKIMCRESLYFPFASELKKFLEKFLKKAKTFAYVERRDPSMFKADECRRVLLAVFQEKGADTGRQKDFVFRRISNWASKWEWEELEFSCSSFISVQEVPREKEKAAYVTIDRKGFVEFFESNKEFGVTIDTWSVFILSRKDSLLCMEHYVHPIIPMSCYK